MAQDAVKTTTKAPSGGGQHHDHQSSQQFQRRIPITTPKPRPQSPGSQHSSLDENNRARESETTATIRVEKNPNFTPTQSVPPNEYTTISAGRCRLENKNEKKKLSLQCM